MLGKPEPYITEKMKEHIEKLGKIKDVSIVTQKISEPKLDEKSKMFMCFAEVEIQCSDMLLLTQIVLEFMPSEIEVVDPAEIPLTCKDSTDMLNILASKMHSYDAIVRELDIRLKSAVKIMTDNGLIKNGKLTEEASKNIKKE